jgi:hypothetical protein
MTSHRRRCRCFHHHSPRQHLFNCPLHCTTTTTTITRQSQTTIVHCTTPKTTAATATTTQTTTTRTTRKTALAPAIAKVADSVGGTPRRDAPEKTPKSLREEIARSGAADIPQTSGRRACQCIGCVVRNSQSTQDLCVDRADEISHVDRAHHPHRRRWCSSRRRPHHHHHHHTTTTTAAAAAAATSPFSSPPRPLLPPRLPLDGCTHST